MRRAFVGAALVLTALVSSGCGTITSSGPVPADASASWALLPVENLSSTPLAGRNAAALVETRLRARGVSRIARVVPAEGLGLVAMLNDSGTGEETLQRARAAGHRYAIGGTVHEWHYKNAPDREPVVGLSLSLYSVPSGRVLWQGNAARSGWGGANLSSVADTVVDELLNELHIADPDD